MQRSSSRDFYGGHLEPAPPQLERLLAGAGADLKNTRTRGKERHDSLDLRRAQRIEVLVREHLPADWL